MASKLRYTNFHIHLDEDLWMEILKNLPIKTLAQIRCVCKPWNSLISSSLFINHHFSLTHDHHDHHLILLDHHPLHILYNPQDPSKPKTLPIPSQYRIMSVVRGVVCLSCYSRRYKGAETIVLWNPTIHKHVELPRSLFDGSAVAIGFGFDESRNDFKVIRIWGRGFQDPRTYEVYSAREGRWRKKKAVVGSYVASYIFPRKVGCFANGAIHWVLRGYYDDHQYLLLMFDCEREVFETMDLQKEMLKDKRHVLDSPFIYRGMLSVLTIYWRHWLTQEVELWAMEEYGVWKKQPKTKQEEGLGRANLHRQLSTTDVDAIKELIRLKKPENERVFEESMFLMDLKRKGGYYLRSKIKNIFDMKGGCEH